MDGLYKKLKEYNKKNIIPFHMPGGKRNPQLRIGEPFELDITEIDGFDDLHDAKGVLAAEMYRGARLFKADEALLLVNGSTAGVLAAVCGAVLQRDKVLVARNAHISVINAIIMRNLTPVYILPEKDENGIDKGITATQVKEALAQEPDIKAVIITSPTYEGVVSEVKEISMAAHAKGVPLIVDGAHGAHLAFNPLFPPSAQEEGADATIVSLHKTLPALTQTGLLLLNGSLINKDRIKYFWNAYQTTSPSYLLMASISACFDILESEQGRELMEHYVKRLITLRMNLNNNLENIRLFQSDDPSKLVFLADDGRRLCDRLLSEYNIQLEMGTPDYAIAMTSLADTKEMYNELSRAVRNLDRDFAPLRKQRGKHRAHLPETGMVPWRAVEYNYLKSEDVNIKNAAGRVVTENLCIYPPGIPVAVAGEVLDPDIIGKITDSTDRDEKKTVRCLITD